MSSLAHSLVTWEEFLHLPERSEQGKRYELHDGEVVVRPPARPLHLKLQKRIEQLLEASAANGGVVATGFISLSSASQSSILDCRCRLRATGRLGRFAAKRIPGICSAINRRSSFSI